MINKVRKETQDVVYIREFISHICNKDFAKANASLSSAIKEKVKNRIRKTLKESN